MATTGDVLESKDLQTMISDRNETDAPRYPAIPLYRYEIHRENSSDSQERTRRPQTQRIMVSM